MTAKENGHNAYALFRANCLKGDMTLPENPYHRLSGDFAEWEEGWEEAVVESIAKRQITKKIKDTALTGHQK